MTREDVWTQCGFSQEKFLEFLRIEDAEDAASCLAGLLGLDDYRFHARNAIRLDYAAHTLEFAKELQLGPIRTASFFNIAQNILRGCIAGASLTDAEANIKTELLSVCRAKPGLDSPYVSPEQVAQIGQYFARTLLSHYRLYQHCFTKDQDVTEYTDTLLIETPIIPPFDSAIPESEWRAQLEQARLDKESAEHAELAAKAAAAEAAEQERLEQQKADELAARQAELENKPATLEEAVEQMVALRLEKEKELLAASYKAKEEVLVQKIQGLEAKIPSGGKTPTGGKK